MKTPNLSILINVTPTKDGKDLAIKSNVRMEVANIGMISLALANIEITKLQLINEYMKLNKIEKKDE